MAMTANGLAKLLEELGELSQVAAKKLAYFDTDEHPDGEAPLSIRLENEMADVMASIEFVRETLGLSSVRINSRAAIKLRQYWQWHNDPNN